MTRVDALARYRRQIVLPEIGIAGQQRLGDARVLIVGAGGLGSPAALYLAAAGVGTLGVVDDDVVELSNLHRQILHSERDAGEPKAESAARTLARLNSTITVRAHPMRLSAENAAALIADYDLVVDGSDNYATRYAVNDSCARSGTPWVYGSVERFSGQVSVFLAPSGPCYRCLFPEPPSPGSSPNCEEIGVLGAVPGVIGALQATEALKLLAGVGEPLAGRLLQVDFLSGQFRQVHFGQRADCPACSTDPTYPERMTDNPVSALPPIEIDPAEARTVLQHDRPPLLLDVREPWEVQRATLADATTIPLRELQKRADGLDRGRDLIVYCHHGGRSRMATEWLRARGFRARNLSGGIDRWSREIDGSVPRY